MNRYGIALGKKIPRKVKKKSEKLKSSCSSCEFLQSRYVGDGFDQFYEWKCRASKLRLIGHDEPFDPCKFPAWCPKLKCTEKDHTIKGKTRPVRCAKCGHLFVTS